MVALFALYFFLGVNLYQLTCVKKMWIYIPIFSQFQSSHMIHFPCQPVVGTGTSEPVANVIIPSFPSCCHYTGELYHMTGLEQAEIR